MCGPPTHAWMDGWSGLVDHHRCSHLLPAHWPATGIGAPQFTMGHHPGLLVGTGALVDYAGQTLVQLITTETARLLAPARLDTGQAGNHDQNQAAQQHDRTHTTVDEHSGVLLHSLLLLLLSVFHDYSRGRRFVQWHLDKKSRTGSITFPTCSSHSFKVCVCVVAFHWSE